ncbi:cytochrome P450 [Mycolicibacterium sp. 624]
MPDPAIRSNETIVLVTLPSMTTAAVHHTYYDDAPMRPDRSAAMDYLRRPGEVYRAGDVYYITSREGVRYAQTHPEIFSSEKAFDGLSAMIQLIPLAVDPPDHARYRKVLDPFFGPKRMRELEDGLRAQVRAHIDAFAPTGQCEVMADLARKFPTQAILTLLGLPHDDLPQCLDWIDGLFHSGTVEQANGEASARQMECSMALFGYLQDKIAHKRAHPGDDLISGVLAITGDDAWTDEQMLGMCFVLVLAGLDTVTAAIGFCLLRLAEDPALRRTLIADPARLPFFIEEVLRLDGPAQMVPRATTQDVEVAGTLIPAGTQVVLVLGTANREGLRSTNVDVIDLDERITHLAFGGGIHRCLGVHLARAELRLMLEEFHARIPDYRLADIPKLSWPAAVVSLETLSLTFPPS